MFNIRSLMLLTNLLVPVLMFASDIVRLNSPVVPIIGLVFASFTSFLVAASTTRTNPYFLRKLTAAGILAITFFFATFVVFWTWAEEKRVFESDEWSPLSVAVLTGPVRGLSGLFCGLAALGLFWLIAVVEAPEPL